MNKSLLFIAFSLAACGNRPSVGMDTSVAAPVECAEGSAIFQSASGSQTDVTSELTGGTTGSPQQWSATEDGTLTFCGGEWTVSIDLESANVDLVGSSDFEPPVLSGGGVTNHLNVHVPGSTVLLENLIFTEGHNCWGSVVRAVDAGDLYVDGNLVAEGCDYIYTPVSVDLTLQDVQITGNDYPEELGGGMIGVTESTVTLNNTSIVDNLGHGIVALNSDVICNGAVGEDAGIQNMTKNGVWMMGDDLAEQSSYTTTSNGCDWGNNGYNDVLIGDIKGPGGFSDFGEDANFVCESSSLLCQ